ncbi:hypothetical protein QNH47_06255 [Virgibacillus halodenitrificans]|uniref:hypothetical protein n=1 Tax=Virgibacillus halodenitrificans TaxID=1482 RepID=UPI0024BF6EAA|nr:hypothetical protein [Virgibacillus halodenitrificans]WHX27455.1 hypothetical protein QNH47_06255 [Virgibacillus halodenitrificans]
MEKNNEQQEFEDLLIKLTKKQAEEMAALEVEPPEKFINVNEGRVFPKLCYEKSFEYFMDMFVDFNAPGHGVMVNGVVKSNEFGSIFGHAWVEIENSFVFDGVLQRFYDKDEYYAFYNVGKTFKFPPNKILDLINSSNSAGYYPKIEIEVSKETLKRADLLGYDEKATI